MPSDVILMIVRKRLFKKRGKYFETGVCFLFSGTGMTEYVIKKKSNRSAPDDGPSIPIHG
jgi:hypothetical protein